MTDKHHVRATLEPDVVREVSGAELLDLSRQGLLHSYDRTDAAQAALGGSHVKTPGKWKAADKPSEIVTASPALTDAPASADEKGE